MRDSTPTRAASATPAVGRSGRAAGLAFEAGLRIWRSSTQRSKGRALATSCLGAAGAVLALAGMWSACGALGQARVVSGWARAPGVMLASNVERGCGGDPNAYAPRVRYRYAVDGVTYVGERAALSGSGCGSERAATQSATRYPVDSKVEVRYDPVRVTESALSVGESTWAAWLGVVTAAALAVACGFSACRGLRRVLSNG